MGVPTSVPSSIILEPSAHSVVPVLTPDKGEMVVIFPVLTDFFSNQSIQREFSLSIKYQPYDFNKLQIAIIQTAKLWCAFFCIISTQPSGKWLSLLHTFIGESLWLPEQPIWCQRISKGQNRHRSTSGQSPPFQCRGRSPVVGARANGGTARWRPGSAHWQFAQKKNVKIV